MPGILSHSFENTCYGEELKELTLEQYRGFQTSQTVEFAHTTGQAASGLTIICGENNSGKSSIFDALDKLWTADDYGRGIAWHEPILESDEKHRTGTAKFVMQTCDGKVSSKEYLKRNKIALPASDPTSYAYRLFLVGTDPWLTKGKIRINDRDLDSFTHELIDDRTMSYQSFKEIIDTHFGNYLLAICRDPARKRRFNQRLRQIIPTLRDWQVRIADDGTYSVIIKGYSKQRHGANLLGNGVLRLFKIISALMDEYSLPVIDEPELHLHPAAQKRLAILIAEYAARKQVIIFTHSPHFVRWKDIEAGAHISRTFWSSTDNENKIVNLSNLSEEIKFLQKLAQDWFKPFLLDTVAKEIFFTDRIVFVEGQEDVAFINKLIEDEGLQIQFDWFGYGAGGAGNIRQLVSLALKIGLKVGAIYDGDKSKEHKEALTEFGRKALIKILSKDDIRDKYDPCKKTLVKEGYFDVHGKIKSRRDKKELLTLIEALNVYLKPKISKI